MENEIVKKLEFLNENIMDSKQMNEIFGGNMKPEEASIDTVTCTPGGNKLDDGDPEA